MTKPLEYYIKVIYDRRGDIHLSNLRKAIEAMGGELVIIARFPNVDVCLNNIAMENRQVDVVTENDYKAL